MRFVLAIGGSIRKIVGILPINLSDTGSCARSVYDGVCMSESDVYDDAFRSKYVIKD
jgi:hypothetical protein